MVSHFQFSEILIFIVMTLASLGKAQTSACPSDVGKAGSEMGQALCKSGGGGNANGTGTAFVPQDAATIMKRQNGQIQNFSSIIEKYPYQLSPYFKPAAVLRGCTGSIVTTYDTEDANLNGRGQTVVSQRKSCSSTSPIQLFSGLGRSVQVIEEDIYFDGWVIHITDDYFTIPTLLSSTLQTIGGTSLFANSTASSISAFDFVPSITAFVPSDSAFATALRCGQGSTATISALALLSANIVGGSVAYSPLLVDGSFFRSISGNDLTVSVINGTKYVNGARILQEDIVIQNGVVHIVDTLVSNDTGLHCPSIQTTTTNINSVTAIVTKTIVATVTETSSNSICSSISPGSAGTATLVSTRIISISAQPVTTILTVTAPTTTIITATNPSASVSTVTASVTEISTITNTTASTITVMVPTTTVLTVTNSNTTVLTVTSPTTIVRTITNSTSSISTVTVPTTMLLTVTNPSTTTITVTSPTTIFSTQTTLTTVSLLSTLPTTISTTTVLTSTPLTTSPKIIISTSSTLISPPPPQSVYQSTNTTPSFVSPTTSCSENEIPSQTHGYGPAEMSKGPHQSHAPSYN